VTRDCSRSPHIWENIEEAFLYEKSPQRTLSFSVLRLISVSVVIEAHRSALMSHGFDRFEIDDFRGSNFTPGRNVGRNHWHFRLEGLLPRH
jgi:hypothetical protein